jgi:nucleoside diphosphate kinase
MAEELSYVALTPYSIRKSRTGGILSRLLSRTALDLVDARMFAPSAAFVEEFTAGFVTDQQPEHAAAQALLKEYVAKNFPVREGAGTQSRVMVLLFKGEDAVRKVREAVGHILNERTAGETIRDTYGDYCTDAQGKVVYFEPAVIAPPDTETAVRDLKLWAKYSDADGGFLDNAVLYPEGTNVERTLVLIKPDNFRFPNARPGGVIDLLSRTGLYIIAAKVHHMSVAEASDFYGPVLAVLQDKLRGRAGEQAAKAIAPVLDLEISTELQTALGEVLGPVVGRDSWEDIVEFMCGRRPSACPVEERSKPGTAKIVALVYQGADAVRKIREVLGPTDPAKAPPGTIRREYGSTIMVNAAHASDSAENAQREIKLLNLEINSFKQEIESTLGA